MISKNLLTHDVQICEAAESLNSCLGDSVIQNCFNVDDFKNVPFARDSEGARKYILGYNQVSFFCSAKGTRKLGLLIRQMITKLIVFVSVPECTVSDVLLGCVKEGVIDCKGHAENVKCIEEVYTKLCGAKWGCTEEKFLTYDMCYSCSEDNICKSPTAANDSIDKMCTSDATSSFNNQLMAALAILVPLFSIV